MNTSIKFLLPLLVAGAFSSCNPEVEELELEKPEAYTIPLEVGKFITYRLDSTVFVKAGRAEETHSYQEKNVVDAQFTDNSGSTAYRIYRYLRDANGTGSWIPSGTYTITPFENSVEVNENNMRVIVLTRPIKEGQSWKGNRYLGPEPYSSLHTFSNDDNMGDWNFVIESVGGTETYNNKTINDIITVSHADEATNVPITDVSSFASKIYSLDKYAKGIGLVYQEHVLWEYQPNPNGTAYKTGFGIKRSLLDHN